MIDGAMPAADSEIKELVKEFFKGEVNCIVSDFARVPGRDHRPVVVPPVLGAAQEYILSRGDRMINDVIPAADSEIKEPVKELFKGAVNRIVSDFASRGDGVFNAGRTTLAEEAIKDVDAIAEEKRCSRGLAQIYLFFVVVIKRFIDGFNSDLREPMPPAVMNVVYAIVLRLIDILFKRIREVILRGDFSGERYTLAFDGIIHMLADRAGAAAADPAEGAVAAAAALAEQRDPATLARDLLGHVLHRDEQGRDPITEWIATLFPHLDGAVRARVIQYAQNCLCSFVEKVFGAVLRTMTQKTNLDRLMGGTILPSSSELMLITMAKQLLTAELEVGCKLSAPRLSFEEKSSGKILAHSPRNKGQFLPEEFSEKFPENVESLHPKLEDAATQLEDFDTLFPWLQERLLTTFPTLANEWNDPAFQAAMERELAPVFAHENRPAALRAFVAEPAAREPLTGGGDAAYPALVDNLWNLGKTKERGEGTLGWVLSWVKNSIISLLRACLYDFRKDVYSILGLGGDKGRKIFDSGALEMLRKYDDKEKRIEEIRALRREHSRLQNDRERNGDRLAAIKDRRLRIIEYIRLARADSASRDPAVVRNKLEQQTERIAKIAYYMIMNKVPYGFGLGARLLLGADHTYLESVITNIYNRLIGPPVGEDQTLPGMQEILGHILHVAMPPIAEGGRWPALAPAPAEGAAAAAPAEDEGDLGAGVGHGAEGAAAAALAEGDLGAGVGPGERDALPGGDDSDSDGMVMVDA